MSTIRHFVLYTNDSAKVTPSKNRLTAVFCAMSFDNLAWVSPAGSETDAI